MSYDNKSLGHVYEKVKRDRYDDEDMIDEEEEAESVPWTKTNTTIDQFTLWKKDSAPIKEDPRINALQSWIDISKAVRIFLSVRFSLSNIDFFFFVDS